MLSEFPVRPVVYIVDDEAAVRKAVARLVRSVGMQTAAFASPDELLQEGYGGEPGCIVLDVRLPGMTGFELHQRLIAAGHRPAVVYITAHHDDRARDRAREMRAVAFLEKPFDDRELLESIEAALRVDSENRERPART